MFVFRDPYVVVRDPELIKRFTVKDFDYFEDHRALVDADADELFGNSLFMMKGQKWRDMRATLSPAFTGSRMREMFELVTECADDMAKYLVKRTNEGKKIDFEMKELFCRYTNDVIASCAFGIRVNSLEDPNNEFFAAGRKITSGGKFAQMMIAFILIFLRVMPRLAKKLNIQMMPASVRKFISKVVTDTMDERQKRGIFRPDMINILMKVRQGEITYDEAADQMENFQKDSAGFATVEESNIGRKRPQRRWNDAEIMSQVKFYSSWLFARVIIGKRFPFSLGIPLLLCGL